MVNLIVNNNNDENIYIVNFCQLIATSVSSILLLLSGFYQCFKFRRHSNRKSKNPTRNEFGHSNSVTDESINETNANTNSTNKSSTLFSFHNLRSSLVLILLAINSLELCRSLVPLPQKNYLIEIEKLKYNNLDDKFVIYAPPFVIENSILTICLTLILIGFHRILEIKNIPELLYLSTSLDLILSGIRFYQINYKFNIIELESFLNCTTGSIWFCLAIIDGFTIYKESFKTKLKEKITNGKKIGYKHTRSTFFSKILFWWLNPLLWHGYKEPLEQEDLGYLHEEDSAKAYYDHFILIYKTACTQKKNPSLWLCYLKSSWKWFTLGGILKLFGDLSALIGPLSIHQIVEYIEQQYSINNNSIYNRNNNHINNITKLSELLKLHRNHEMSSDLKQMDSSLTMTYDNQQMLPIKNHDFHQIINFYYYINWTELLNNGWVIAWIVLMASLAQGGLSQASTHLLNMTGIRIKTSLQGLIYRKTLLLSSSCLDTMICNKNTDGDLIDNGIEKNNSDGIRKLSNSSSNGQNGKRDTGSITNLMSEDALNIMSLFWIAHYVWAIPLKIGLVMYLLYLKLGISAIIGSVVCIFTMTPLQFLIGKAMSKNAEKAAKCTDERLKRTNDVFLGIKLIKLNAWEKVFIDKIQSSRKNELKYLNRDSFYWTVMTFLTHVSSVLIAFVTLAFYVKLENDNSLSSSNIISQQKFTNNYFNVTGQIFENPEFTASRLFSALALFNQLTVPLLIFPITVPIIISAIVSTKRLERFLAEPEVQREFEGIRNMARILSKSDASLDMYEIDRKISLNMIVQNKNDNDINNEINNIILSGNNRNIDKSKQNHIINEIYTGEEEGLLLEPTTSTTTAIVSNNDNNKKLRYYNNNENDPNMKMNLIHKNNRNLNKLSDNQIVQENTEGNINNNNNCTGKIKLRREYNSHTLPKKHSSKDLLRGICKPISGVITTSNLSSSETITGCTILQIKNNSKKKIITSRESFSNFQTNDSVAVSIVNGIFSWDNCNTLLNIDKIDIPKGKLTIIVGKNGSGKSSMLAALLKEMQQISGNIAWNKYSTIAYVPQTPWLLNASIRDNILFGESFRPKRYEKVIESCALKPDIELMPDGDMTIIGERGINLSGGQKQRIVIARSLYSSANVVIMDDPLSSLDNEVAKHVFENSIKKMLLKANRTIILVTQRLQLVYNADYIIVMKDGCVQSAGNYSEIENNHPDVITEWNSIIAKENDKDQISPGKTARERWKLFKNISRIGLLQRPQETEQEHMMSTPSLYMQSKRRSSIFGSRHLIYDIPLPIDECQNDDIIIKRRNSTSRRSLLMMMGLLGNSGGTLSTNSELKNTPNNNRKNPILRVNSLQPEMRYDSRTPVVRNISSPGRFHDPKNRLVENEFKPKTGFRQFLNRMSSRRSNVGSRLHRTISASNSIQSISEESHQTLNRTETSSSECLDDESIQDLQDINDDGTNRFYDEERKYGEIPLQIYMLYLKSCGLSIVLIFFISALLWQCLRVYTDVWLRNWTELTYSYNDNNNKIYDVTYYFNVYTIISCFCIIMSLITTPAGQKAGCNAREILHNQLVNSILGKSLHFFQTTPLGKILNRFSNDMAIIDKKIAPTSQRLLQFTLLCLFAVLINLAITPWFIILTIPICLAYYIIQKFYRCSSRELQRLENITNSPVISHFNETIQGVTTIRAYNQEARFTETLFKRLEANTIAFVILNTSNRWLGIALDYLGGIIVFVAIVTALVASSLANIEQKNFDDEFTKSNTNINMQYQQQKQNQQQSPSPSLVGLAINYTLLVPIYLNWVVKLLSDMEMYVGSVERVAYYQLDNNDDDADHNKHDVVNDKMKNDNYNINNHQHHLDNVDDVVDDEEFIRNCCKRNKTISSKKYSSTTIRIENNMSSAQNRVIYTKVPISWPQKGDIIFEHVSLRYQGQSLNVITDLSLQIPAGQRIGICGRTGSGKSSLALSLFSVLDVISGKILIDDVDITKIHPDETRSRLSIIPQDVHLFNATIRENLDPRGYYSDLELWNCLELAQLKDIVSGMPQGLDTEIIEGGGNLSGGQRQLFCLARAVLRGSVCLVLDEATSSLDTITEKSLMNAAHNAFKGRTILTIAHRLTTLLNYDRIIVLENGQIVEDGTPTDLKNLPNGKFLTMLNSV